MRKSERDKRTYLIIGLCAVLVVMVVGFAAFSSQLTINGTSEISSNWDVHIKDNGVTYKNAVDATSTLAEKTSNLVATFACNLITPGKSVISYDVVVENKGTLNAKLDSINLTGGNSAIAVVTSPTNASLSTSPIVLAPNDEATITVTVSYNDINNQPTGSGLTTNITAQLNFSQTNDSPTPVTPTGTYVYRWSTSTWQKNQDISGMSEGTDYVTSASAVTNMDAKGANYYLKYKIENNIVTESYVCFVTDTEHCLRGGDGGTAYSSNVSELSSQQSWFTGQNPTGSCLLNPSSYNSVCYGGPFISVDVASNGDVRVNGTDDVSCNVNVYGYSYCNEPSGPAH